MLDRVPLKEATDPVPATPENPPIPVGTNPEQGLSDMQGLSQLADMMGFDGFGFEGLGREAETIYQWGKDTAGDGIAALSAIKNLIRTLGTNSKGKELVQRVYRWVALENQKAEIQKRQELIYD